MSYSDDWIKLGCTKGNRTMVRNGEPVNYNYWYHKEKLIGACIHLEYADDIHYEFTWLEFEKLRSLWGKTEQEFLQSLELFFDKEKPCFIFSEFLENHGIEYRKIVFY